MKTLQPRYQSGSIRKVPHSNGRYSWEFRYYATGKDGKRKAVSQTFDGVLYKTQRHVRKAVEGQMAALNSDTLVGKVDATLSKILDRYIRDDLPNLKHSTQETYRGTIENYVRPKWGDYRLADIRPMEVKHWLDTLKFGPASKVRCRNMLSLLMDRAMLWEYIPVERNPMQLVKVKGSSMRTRLIVIITPGECMAIMALLPEPYNLMVLTCACLGLSVSEMLALRWDDFNWEALTVTINQVFTHGRLQESPKTMARGATLPIYEALATALQEWRMRQEWGLEFVFTSPKTGGLYSASTVSTDYLKPAALKAGIKGFGWHSLRHSYKTWMSAEKVAPGTMKDLMRHSDIGTTMDVYGHTLTPELRSIYSLIARKLFMQLESTR